MGKSRTRNNTKSKTKARQAAKKTSKKTPKSITPKSPPTLSTTNDVNPKSTNTYDRPPSPIIEDCDVANHDTSSDTSHKSPPEISTYKDVVKESLDTSVTEKPQTTSFHLCKDIHD